MLDIIYRLLAVSSVSALSWMLYQLALICHRGAVLARQFRNPPVRNKLMGHVAEVSTPDIHRLMLQYVKDYGPIFRLRLIWRHTVVVTEPTLVSEILHHPDLDKLLDLYAAISAMMTSSSHPDLLTGPTDERWRLVRKGVAASFSPANIRIGFKYSAACGEKLVEVLRAKGPNATVDIDEACLSETLDVIGLFGFRHDYNAVSKFAEGGHAHIMDVMKCGAEEAERRMADPFRAFTSLLTKEGRAERSSFAQFHKITRDLLAELKARGPPADDDESLGAQLLRIRDADGKPLPDEQLLPHIGILFAAGMDTTGHAMAWSLFHICQHPEVEAQIVKELHGLGLLATPQQPRPRALEYADLGKLTYLSCAIKEALRMKPVAANGTARVALRDIVLGGGKYRIPANTGLWMPTFSIQNSELNWGPDADVYRPERWLEPGAEYVQQHLGDNTAGSDPSRADVSKSEQRQNYELGSGRDFAVRQPGAARIKRYIPFSDGRRDCVGQALARMNYTSTLAQLLGNFHFELAPESGGAAGIAAEETMAITLRPGPKGILMRCIPRSTST